MVIDDVSERCQFVAAIDVNDGKDLEVSGPMPSRNRHRSRPRQDGRGPSIENRKRRMDGRGPGLPVSWARSNERRSAPTVPYRRSRSQAPNMDSTSLY